MTSIMLKLKRDSLNGLYIPKDINYFDFDKGTYMQDYERVFNVTGDQVFGGKGHMGQL